MSSYFRKRVPSYSIGREILKGNRQTESLFVGFFIFGFLMLIVYLSFYIIAVVIIILVIAVIIKTNTHYESKPKDFQKEENHITEQKMNSSINSKITPDSSFKKPNLQRQLGTDYISNRNALKDTFPAAYNFLCNLKSTPRTNIWIGTAVNAHLYLDNKFLTYIILEPESLIFSSRFHNRIAHNTTDQSKLLFPILFRQIIQAQSGFELGWAREFSNGTFEIYSKAPSVFFDELIKSIKSLK